jgi:hypothetical protein
MADQKASRPPIPLDLRNLSRNRPEIEVVIEESDEKSTGSKDSSRSEMPWEVREEDYLLEIVSFCENRAERHLNASWWARKLYVLFNLPTIMTPAVLASTQEEFGRDGMLSEKMVLVGSAVFAGISSFMNFGKVSARHTDFGQKYEELHDKITFELCKPKKYRVQCDVFLERIMQQYLSLNKTAPDLGFI